ncbi:MAG: 6-bladed beta-propeller [Bacteroidales bacterium]|nr:6-bladed beta-propeller [Bacteroidales bacterium]
MKKLNIIIYFILFLLASCSDSNTKKAPSKIETKEYSSKCNNSIINFEEILSDIEDKTTYYLDEYIDTIMIIKLETNDDVLLGDASYVKLSDKYIYVNDMIHHQFVIFDHNGKYINSLKHGNGPGEFNFISSFTHNKYTNELILTDYSSIKIYSELGEYKKSFDYPNTIKDMITFENGYVCYQTPSWTDEDHKSKLIITDFDFNVKKSFSFDRVYPSIFAPYQLSCNNDTIICSIHYDDKVYYIKDTTIQVKYKYELGDYAIKYEDNIDLNSDKYENVSGKFIVDGLYAECNDYQEIVFDNNFNRHSIFRNKKTGKMIGGNYNPSSSGLGLFIDYFYLLGTYNNYFCKVLSRPIVDNKYLELLSTGNQISQEDLTKIKEFNMDDNPLIILYSIKGLE